MMSNFLNLNYKDLLKGLFITVLTTILGWVYTIIQTGLLPTLDNLKTIWLAGLGAGISYLIKNLLSSSKWELFTTETPKA